MAFTMESLAQEATGLSPDQRFSLARRILASLEPDETPAVEAAWEAAIRERIRRYDAGETRGIPAAEVFGGLDRRLAR